MPGTLFVGLDVGTTTSKAVLFTRDGEPVASGRETTPWTVTPTGAELDATALLDAAKAAVAEALADCPAGPIGGLGVASIAESSVLLDGRGEPVAPVIAWHDTRDSAELACLEEAVGAQRFSATTGLPLRQQWSLTKHRWLLDNVPSARDAVRRLNVAEWIVRGLGGDEATEQSLASRTGWLRLAERDWWDDTLDWSGATAAGFEFQTTSAATGGASSRSVSASPSCDMLIERTGAARSPGRAPSDCGGRGHDRASAPGAPARKPLAQYGRSALITGESSETTEHHRCLTAHVSHPQVAHQTVGLLLVILVVFQAPKTSSLSVQSRNSITLGVIHSRVWRRLRWIRVIRSICEPACMLSLPNMLRQS